MIRFPAFSFAVALCLILFSSGFSLAQRQKHAGERIVMCMIQLEYADAEELAAALEPFLSPEGTIAPYRPTNILIIRDRASVVDKLSTAIKGRPCTPITHPPEAETDLQQEELYLDQ
jgi:type II secretory pathway component GspD/PulD (secretin)